MSLDIELARLKANPTGAWLQGPKVTAENVKRGTGNVQHITADEFFSRPSANQKRTGQAGAVASHKMAAQPQTAHVMRFGKRKGALMADVKEDDPGYWSWLLENVSGFSAQAKKAGLLDDES